MHEHAVQAEKHLEQLATGLAKEGMDDAVVQTVTKMADVARKLVSALGKGQESTGDAEPPAPVPAPQPAPRSTAEAAGQIQNDMRARAGN